MPRPAAAALALGAALALVLTAPLAANAHVTLDGNTAEPGSYPLLTFKVPTESESASTTAITVTLTDAPFASVRTVAQPGWSSEIGRDGSGAATSVTFTATGDGIGPDELGLFQLSVGPVPDTGSIVLPVSQSYSDGSVVDWADTADGADHPAPVLYVNDAPVDHHHDAGTTDEAGAGDSGDGMTDGDTDHGDATVTASGSSSGPDALARVFGIGGLVLGAAALVVAIVGRRPRPAASGAASGGSASGGSGTGGSGSSGPAA
ncbi:MAG: YcnI family protein [Actinomycetales bacterium]|nr:YcnI family protein [Actinomycetales bacterium]